VQKRIRVLVLAATIAVSLLAGAGQAAADTGTFAAPAAREPAPLLITTLGVTWE